MARNPDISTPTDARILRSREALRTALLQLLESKSFDDISIRDIVAKAGIAYTTFFRHHPAKEALLDEIAAQEISRLVAISFPVLESVDSRASCVALCTYVDQNRALWTTLLTGGAASVLRDAFIEESFNVTVARPNLRSALPAELGNVLVASSILEVLKWWLQQNSPASIAEVAKIIDLFVVTPVLKMQ